LREGVIFTMKDAKRYSVMEQVSRGAMTNCDAAAALNLSVRQIKRIKKKVGEKGLEGILHGNRSRPSARAFPFREQVVKLVKAKYFDYNFTHLSEELLDKEGLSVNRETLRQWLRPLGFGGKVRKQPHHRKRRKRAEREGQMLFLDGSPHRWFGNELSTLILCTDDATGKPLYGLFQEQEDLDGCFHVCLEVFNKYGLPVKFYLDRASQFTTTRQGGLYVAQRDTEPTQFERAMEELGVKLIFAHSPQARGRGERINQTFQDRLVSELRLHRIKAPEDATRYLNETSIPKYSRRFGVKPEDEAPSWRKAPSDLLNILCKRFERKVTNDNTVSVKKEIIQLLPTKTRRHFVKASVWVNLWIDGTWHVIHPTYGEIPCKLASCVRPARAATSLVAGERSESTPLGVTY
jgi:transposase